MQHTRMEDACEMLGGHRQMEGGRHPRTTLSLGAGKGVWRKGGGSSLCRCWHQLAWGAARSRPAPPQHEAAHVLQHVPCTHLVHKTSHTLIACTHTANAPPARPPHSPKPRHPYCCTAQAGPARSPKSCHSSWPSKLLSCHSSLTDITQLATHMCKGLHAPTDPPVLLIP